MDTDAYCREIEAHLCRRNAGHLVRVAGPAFDMVSGWASRGIPLKVAIQGIDRVVERRAARAPGRRPLRIEFCEADVLDAFDEWRRAVGVATAGGRAVGVDGGGPPVVEGPSRPGRSLRAHLDRVVTRLTDRIADGALPPALEPAIERLMAHLDRARSDARTLRGEARRTFIARLQVLDTELLDAAHAATPGETLDALRREAEEELAAFRGRMADDALARAVGAATARLLRQRLRLPEIGYGED